MTRWLKPAAAVIVVIIGAISLQPALSADKLEVVKHRQATMKRMSADLKTIHEYGQGKADHAKAVAAAEEIVKLLPSVPGRFPTGTATDDFPGKSGAKPAIWKEWNRFVDAQKHTLAQADHLLAAVKSGDKAAAMAGPGKLWDDGCQSCHKPFRQKI